MPNWCQNTLTVYGDKEKREEFIEQCNVHDIVCGNPDKKGDLLDFGFNGIVCPPRSIIKAGYSIKGYDWCNANWGTKWQPNHYDTYENEEENKTVIDMWTAWAPPKPFVQQASEQFPDLEFKLGYFEGGGSFAGLVTLEEGMITGGKSESDYIRHFAKKYLDIDFEEHELEYEKEMMEEEGITIEDL